MSPEQKEVIDHYRDIVQETTEALSDDVKALRVTLQRDLPKALEANVDKATKALETSYEENNQKMCQQVNSYSPVLMKISLAGNIVLVVFAAIMFFMSWDYRHSPQKEAELAGQEASRTILREIPDLRSLEDAAQEINTQHDLLQANNNGVNWLHVNFKALMWGSFGYYWPDDPDPKYRHFYVRPSPWY